MVVRLRALAAEVTSVSLEVGSQGKSGGQAHVPDVERVWFELVRNVSNLPLLPLPTALIDIKVGESHVFVIDGPGAGAVYRCRNNGRRKG